MKKQTDTRNRIRPDGKAKVTGRLTYLTDLTLPNMLFGKILRSPHAHAKIRRIRTEKAEQIPGVHAVLTHKDVPGVNGFGIIMPDQPVLCEDLVRYVGDAIACVAADSIDIAALALTFIEVEYEELPVIDTMEKALDPDYPTLHPDGNILHKAGHKRGDTEKAFSECAVIVEQTYELPRQVHGYMETEGGVIVPEADGQLTVYVGTQHGFKDQFQLARILNMPESDIRVVSSPMGGSFGGKDELNIQPYGALLALKTGRPVKIHQTRQESIRTSIKRHPMRITMKTGVDPSGYLLAHQTWIKADTGAYSTLGPAVLDFSVEHATGPYVIPAVQTEGLSIITNNGVAGEFRGFGGNQVTFALEGQMDRLADRLHMDPVEFRRMNLRKSNDVGPLGQRIAETEGASLVLETIATQYQQQIAQKPASSKYSLRGYGTAITMHGGGLGYGRLDPAGGRLSLKSNGKIEIAFGFEEAGQGILSVIETLVLEELGCDVEDLSIVIGDTALVPSSGSTTASRGTSMVWHSLQKLKQPFKQKLIELTAANTGIAQTELRLGKAGIWSTKEEYDQPVITYQDLAIQQREEIVTHTRFDFPTTPDPIDSGHFLYTFSGVLAGVEIDLLTGKVKLIQLDQAIAAGPVVNRNGYIGQIEGGGAMAVGYTLMEEALMKEGHYLTTNFDTYLMPGLSDMPFLMNTIPIEDLPEKDIYGPRGVGEIGTVGVAPAIASAVFDAIGIRIDQLPISPEFILQALEEKGGVAVE
ncbi:xanthine dehydrogenase subunit D [Alkalicoccobacillus murimartini]|uniref:Xanthine dehydrogenase D subunit n=1 Tax=Alkalicoccobacillus murimartini TaxID=171685 RepID=A0ABT9YFU9_9BACI|nr:xanthine dehydrogenase subunit D [Alkalicoccobacillus murimartini]MDQ0206734.1 xanthine dehydrogenase D subunit [Alkalicoccobacillus murimartini]